MAGDIKIQEGLPAAVVAALGLREGRVQFEDGLTLSPRIIPVAIVAGGGSSSSSSSPAPSGGVPLTRYALSRSPAGVAAQYPLVQLWNPPGSGKIGYPRHAHVVGAAAAAAYVFAFYNTNIGGSAVSGLAYKNGAGASGLKVHEATTVTLNLGGLALITRAVGVGAADDVVALDDVELQEGEGLLFQYLNVNNTPYCSFVWDE